ncbi:MAG: ImmA/IrrE family metallo-endopeptidase [Alphaproteobacteria bacterium]|nr:ImmA/IrrE family metallo-endopeptidase [Alphaproteobacteria bacterium]MBF0374089.1 ImmA/IrrE family metallo-endopeptidase [Alphaproteobacteria bacterium]
MTNRQLAIEVVSEFMKSAPVDLNGLVNRLGLEVIFDRGLDNGISGIIERTSRGFRIRINAKHHPNRQRFTLAHEIAHYVLHRDLIETSVTDTALYRSEALSDDMERQANNFAAGLIMPASLVRGKWEEGLTTEQGMAAAFQVSSEAARIRMKELRLGQPFSKLFDR